MILAAGAATGLYPLTYTLPAAMVPIANRPSIMHVIDWLASYGVTEIVINLHYLHRAVSDALAKRVAQEHPKIHLTVEAELSGTAGGVALAQNHFEDAFCVVGTDCVTNLDLHKMLEFHQNRRSLCTIAALPVDDHTRYGLMEVNEGDRVLRFVEKPRSPEDSLTLLSTGVYIMEPGIFRHIPDVRPFDFGKHLFPSLVGPRGGLYAYPAHQDGEVYWQDFEDPLIYRQVHRDILQNQNLVELSGQQTQEGVFVGQDCVVSEKAEISPPVLIGDGAVVRDGAKLIGPTVIGNNVVIGEGATIEDSVVWERTMVEPGANVHSSLVGSSCHLRADQDYRGVLLASGARFEKKGISSD